MPVFLLCWPRSNAERKLVAFERGQGFEQALLARTVKTLQAAPGALPGAAW